MNQIKETYNIDIDCSQFDDDKEQFLFYLKDDKDKPVYKAARDMCSTFPNVDTI